MYTKQSKIYPILREPLNVVDWLALISRLAVVVVCVVSNSLLVHWKEKPVQSFISAKVGFYLKQIS